MAEHEWVHMPHPAHFVGAAYCRFHRATYVHGVVVSTIGDYEPGSSFPSDTRPLLDDKYAEIGDGRYYETYVFRGGPRDQPECAECPYAPVEWSEIDAEGYVTREEAEEGHWRMCRKWDLIRASEEIVDLQDGEHGAERDPGSD